MFLNGTRKRKVCRRNAEVDLQVLSKFQFTHVCNKPVQALTQPDAHHQPGWHGSQHSHHHQNYHGNEPPRLLSHHGYELQQR